MTDSSLTAGPGQAAYKLNPLIQLHWRLFDEDWLIFEVLSGQTHQIDKVTAAVLMSFEAGKVLSFSELIGVLAREFNIIVDNAGAAPIASVLDRLCALGLIQPPTLHAVV